MTIPNNTIWTPPKLLDASYKDLGAPDTVGKRFLTHLLQSPSCLTSLLQILTADPGRTGIYDYSLELDVHEFLRMDVILGNMLLRHPGPLLKVLEDAIVLAQVQISKRIKGTKWKGVKGESGSNTRVHARLVHLPPHSSFCKPSVSSLDSRDVGRMIQISGTVVRASKVQMYESKRSYKCCDAKCGFVFESVADLEQWNNALDVPVRCRMADCRSNKFQLLPERSVRSDYQEIKLQESITNRYNNTHGSSVIPRSLLIKLQHDLVDKCQPGDDVVIVGSLMAHWQSALVAMTDCNISMAIHAHSVRVVHGGSGGEDGSCWDRIFEDSARLDPAVNETDGEDGPDTAGRRIRFGMVREDITKEFAEYWSRHETKERPIAARNFICQAVCPTLYGMSIVKMALLLTLIGGSGVVGSTENQNCGGGNDEMVARSARKMGSNDDDDDDDDDEEGPEQFVLGCNNDDDDKASPSKRINNDGNDAYQSSDGGRNRAKNSDTQPLVQTRRREQSHLLLVGDPGTGKSQFLRFAAALCPRSVLTSGSGTTSAGLTCAAVREDSGKEFTLEAGALVLADRGVCAIDEFSCIGEKDRMSIHEAMEQQTLSVAKAGIVCKLNCRATVIAVTNPKGGIYDHEKSFLSNVGIGAPLLSRFDLIFKLIDSSDQFKDDNIATFLLNRAIQGSGYECSKKASITNTMMHWSMDKLRAYIATVKSRFHPTLSRDAAILLQKHYEKCRSSETISLHITVRFFESLIRLSQAHARLMYRDIVHLDDAVSIILLMESSVASFTSGFHGDDCFSKDPLNTIFPHELEADFEFLCEKAKVLDRYEMRDRLSEDECRILAERNQEHFGIPAGGGLHQNDWDEYDGNQNIHSQCASHERSGMTMDGIEDHYGRTQKSQTPHKTAPFGYEQEGSMIPSLPSSQYQERNKQLQQNSQEMYSNNTPPNETLDFGGEDVNRNAQGGHKKRRRRSAD